jgi:ribosomal-protein-alanine N-acetyltransferase
MPGDLAAIHAIMRDDETMRYWSTPPHSSIRQTRDWLAGMLDQATDEGDDFIIEEDGEVIGKLGAWRMPEIGFFVRRERWGQGIATEALAAFIAYAAAHGFTHLTADVDPLNAASLKLLAQAGFNEMGRQRSTYQVGDRVCDSVYLRREMEVRR